MTASSQLQEVELSQAEDRRREQRRRDHRELLESALRDAVPHSSESQSPARSPTNRANTWASQNTRLVVTVAPTSSNGPAPGSSDSAAIKAVARTAP